MQISTGISIASLVVSVITLALVLMLLAGKPGEPSQVELEMSREISEAQRLETCAAIGDMYHKMHPWPSETLEWETNQYIEEQPNYIRKLIRENDGLIAQAIIDNQCADDEIGWERRDPKDAETLN
jgi:hypothetical protein